MKIVKIKTSTIIPYPQNTKKHPEEQIDKIVDSIEEFGFNQPIVLDDNNVIIVGHGRWHAAVRLKLEKVPCMVASDLSEEQASKYRLMDNRTNESDWDLDFLKLELEDLPDLQLEFSDLVDLSPPPNKGSGDGDSAPEVPKEAKTNLGDIYELGTHRLMCGDSKDEKCVEKLTEGEEMKLLLTDPPYGISIVKKDGMVGGSRKAKSGHYRSIIGDREYFNPDFLLKIGKEQIIFGANYFFDNLTLGTRWIVWDKAHPEGLDFSDCELAWTSFKKVSVKKYKCTWNGMIREGESGKRVHPTQKPTKLFSEILEDYTEIEDNVIDLFGGSGTTLIAAEKTNRKCFMMELDPLYCDVIVKRWEDYTGEKAKIII